MIRGIRNKLTYANVMATIAVFIALGGTGYAALTLPRNSVGSTQLRTGSVGTSELRTGAVRSRDIRNGAVALRDVSASARRSLKGSQGEPGPAGASGTALKAAVSSGGGESLGNATAVEHTSGSNVYAVKFGQNTAACVATATLATVQAGATVEEPQAGRVTVGPAADGVVVKTFAADGSPAEQPFHVTVSC